MKIFIALLLAMAIFSGCVSDKRMNRLHHKNIRQAILIQKQHALITKLREKLEQTRYRHTKKRYHRKKTHRKKSVLPPAPKKDIKLKKVEDKNYSTNYMYPEDTKAAKKDPIETYSTTHVATKSMSKQACISMITQEKFEKYTSMFGSEAAAIKRCVMLNAMNR